MGEEKKDEEAPGVMEDVPVDGKEADAKETTTSSSSDGTGSPGPVIVRFLLLAISLVSWALMAAADIMDNYNGFEYLVATGVIVTAWALVGIAVEVCAMSGSLENLGAFGKGYIAIEMFMDIILAFLAFGAFVSAGTVNSVLNLPKSVYDYDHVVASIVFMSFTWAILMIGPLALLGPVVKETFSKEAEKTQLAHGIAP